MHQVLSCPICGGQEFSHRLTCVDHTVSHETFQIVDCKQCHFVLTNPRPDDNNLTSYYQSDTYISHSNTSRTIFDKLYQAARQLTLKWKISLVRQYSHNNNTLNILDYGCGTGEFLHACKLEGHHIVGVEPSTSARKQAEKKTKSIIVSNLSEVAQTFDVITLWHVLEHVADLNEKVQELYSHLAENGTMFIAVPNHQSDDAKYYQNLWAGYDVPRHLWHFSEQSMTNLLQKHNLKLHQVIPMKLDAFYVSMLSEKYRVGKQNLFTLLNGAWHGLKSNIKAGRKNYSSQIFVVRK